MRRQSPNIRVCFRSLAPALFAVSGALAVAAPARAQSKVLPNPANARPNLLLLLDNSGSMELMMNGLTMEQYTCGGVPGATACGNSTSPVPVTQQKNQPCDGTVWPYQNRWAIEMQALTGAMPQYACLDEPRGSGSPFATEFSYWAGQSPLWGGAGGTGNQVLPYDLDYYLDYHRPVEPLSDGNVCVIAANQGSGGYSTANGASHSDTAADFALAGLGGYEYVPLTAGTATSTTKCGDATAPTGACLPSWTGAATPVTCRFGQGASGLMNQAATGVRFALMTIDSDTLPNTGVMVSNPTFTDVANAPPTNLTTGMWSYFNGWTNATSTSWPGSSVGRPTGCTLGDPGNGTVPYFEVGARNPDAPPWEGPLVGFPTTTTAAPDPDPSSNNQQIEVAIRAMRPYGANPIAGLFDDAKYYYWTDPQGPSKTDAMYGCRPNYIVLLTHSAPNLDLQPFCRQSGGAGDAGTGTTAGQGMCPYDLPENIAAGLLTGNYASTGGSGSVANTGSAAGSGQPVETFVVGFAMSSSLCGAGTAYPTCSVSTSESCNDILVPGTTPGTYTGVDAIKCGIPDQIDPVTGSVKPGTAGPEYTQCCQLAKIAAAGGTTIPYFADSAADLQKALAAILAIVTGSESTRAIPVEEQQTANTTTNGGANAALFVSSFQSSQSVAWSGDEQRERYVCNFTAGAFAAQTPLVDPNSGDDFQTNIDTSPTVQRYTMLIYPSNQVNADRHVAAQLTLRPYVDGPGGSATGAAFDGIDMNDGQEYAFKLPTPGNQTQMISPTQFTSDALFGSTACPVNMPGTAAPFTRDDCEQVAFNYLYGAELGPPDWQQALQPFPSRYFNSSSSLIQTHALGGIFHSTPAIETPPSALLQDDAYQAYVQTYASGYAQFNAVSEPRHTVLYVATIDGLLHAFGVDYSATDNYTFNGFNASNGMGKMNELWSFVPPAVMPHLLDSFPTAQTPILDGSPVVKDAVYQRASVGGQADWHTTLVAGMGPPGSIGIGGYYAVDVTDPVMEDTGLGHHTFSNPLTNVPDHQASNVDTPIYMNTTASPPTTAPAPQGPHFLWQLTGGGALPSGAANVLSPIFGKFSGTPAIATVQISDPNDGVKREVGVAILPGGTDSQTPPVANAWCVRSAKNFGGVTTASSTYELHTKVRDWSQHGDCGAGDTPGHSVNGRSLTIARLDTGEILRTFANLTKSPGNPSSITSNDLPSPTAPATLPLFNPPSGATVGTTIVGNFTTRGRVTDALFDSPITGTPIPYPADVGAIAQRIFVSDEDGTLWRVDVSNPDSTQWYVEPFWDAFNPAIEAASALAGNDTSWTAQRTPIMNDPTLSLGRLGNVVLNFGTGDPANLGNNIGGTASVFSIAEIADPSGRLLSRLNWWMPLPNAGEFISGPAAVFDSVYYFTTYAPPQSASVCTTGNAYIWGMDYEYFYVIGSPPGVPPAGSSSSPNIGGFPALLSGTGPVQSIATGQNVPLPGISVTNTAACAQNESVTDQYTGGARFDMQNVSQSQYSVSALVAGTAKSTAAQNSSISNAANVGQFNMGLANGVRSGSIVDSWASIVE